MYVCMYVCSYCNSDVPTAVWHALTHQPTAGCACMRWPLGREGERERERERERVCVCERERESERERVRERQERGICKCYRLCEREYRYIMNCKVWTGASHADAMSMSMSMWMCLGMQASLIKPGCVCMYDR